MLNNLYATNIIEGRNTLGINLKTQCNSKYIFQNYLELKISGTLLLEIFGIIVGLFSDIVAYIF
jgi:predicted Co/Zn/Cd cation transporter (cation efflux family)